jgi:hypothetical protein
MARGAASHLTLLDAEGYPLPMPVTEATRCEEGFRLVVPKGTPWSEGDATLSFEGIEIFVGHARREGDVTILRVERTLPILPLTSDPTEVLQPRPETKATLMARLEIEAARRGQSIPRMPTTPPAPTEGAKYRVEHGPQILVIRERDATAGA